MRQTTMLKPSEVVRTWYVVDATDATLGRLSTKVATVLRGKHKPTFAPNADCGDAVIIINCAKAVLTGKKLEQKHYIWHTGWIGGLKKIQYKELMSTNPDKAMFYAVRGMLPNNTLGDKALTRLRVYAGSEHEQQAQKPEVYNA